MNYEEFKTEVKENYPLRTVLNISSMKMDLDEGSYGTLVIHGSRLCLTKAAFKSFIKTLGLTDSYINKSINLFGANVKNKLIDLAKTKINVEKHKEVAVYIHPKSKNVIAITDTTSPYVSPDFYFNTVENVISDNSLDVSNMNIGSNGDVSISTLNRNWDFNINGMSDEDFSTGVIISSGPTENMSVNPHILRMVCTNGMTAPTRLNIGPSLENTTPENVRTFMKELGELSEANTQFQGVFTDQVKKMDSLYASFDEMSKLKSKVSSLVTDIEDSRTIGVLERFFPTGGVENTYLTKKKIQLDKLSSRHWRNAKTDMTVWELVNSLTDVASHDYGMGIGELAKSKLKRDAGVFMFKKEFDTEFLMS